MVKEQLCPPANGLQEFETELKAVVERTGYPEQAFWAVMAAVETADSPEQVCTAVLRSLSLNHTEPLEHVLEELELQRSIDIGRVFYELIDLKLYPPLPDSTLQHFAGFYAENNLNHFLHKHGIKRNRKQLSLILSIMIFCAIIILVGVIGWETSWKPG